jgi:hypothetical protein
MHGFVSQGYLFTTGNNYLARETKEHGSVEFSEVGLNFTTQLTDQLRLGMQLFARDLGDDGNYKPQFDWYYLDYRFRDWLGIRAGRTKIPFGLYNEVNDVDMARVPILLPQSMYPIENRNMLLAQTGGELYGTVPLLRVGALEYRVYGGTIFAPPPPPSSGPASIEDVYVPYVVGSRFMWQPPVEGLQLGASLQAVRFKLGYQLDDPTTAALVMAKLVPPDFKGDVPGDLSFKLWLVSLEYSIRDLLVAAEYGRWIGRFKNDLSNIFPGVHTVNERGYLMTSYHVTPWFTPGVYYAVFYEDYRDRKGRDAYRHDAAATLRFDINRYWLLKLEGHYMLGTAGLNSDLNDQKPLKELTKHWSLFLIKTTAYF